MPSRAMSRLFWAGEHAEVATLLKGAPPGGASAELCALALVLDGEVDAARARRPRGLAHGFVCLADGALTHARVAFECFVGHTALAPLAHFGLAAVAHRSGDPLATRSHLAAILFANDDLFVTRWASEQWQALFGALPVRPRSPLAVLSIALGLVALGLLALFGMPHGASVVADLAPGATVAVASARLAPERAGIADLYFVSVAGYGAQDVFHNEVLGEERVMIDRFDARDRTLVLSNDPRAEGFYPPASLVTVGQALREVGQRMNVAEDVLFLFLTSHGSTEGPVLDDEPLAPDELRAMLDAAGIRWRVLVIAGCETGVFLEPLANESTLVVTAAASDRRSYGCGNGRTNTEFGRAIFVEELARQGSFSGAFHAAIVAIGKAEQSSGLLPSRPQIAEGAAIGAKLHLLEARTER